jgi:hypothetical protein
VFPSGVTSEGGGSKSNHPSASACSKMTQARKAASGSAEGGRGETAAPIRRAQVRTFHLGGVRRAPADRSGSLRRRRPSRRAAWRSRPPAKRAAARAARRTACPAWG